MELFHNVRELGHTGLLMDYKVYDRAIMSALEKLFDRWATAHHTFLQQTLEEARAHKFRLWQCRSVVGCFGHDCHGDLRWGVLQHSADKQVVWDAYIAVESLRDSFDVLDSNTLPWTQKRLMLEDSTLDVAERTELWILMGLPGE